jgi:hypothetical protein
MNPAPYTPETPALGDLVLPAPPLGCLSPGVLQEISADAARRATALLKGQGEVDCDPVIDLVRLLHERDVTPAEAKPAAERAGVSSATLGRLRLAYSFGGMDGLRTAHQPHTPNAKVMSRAVSAVRRRHTTADSAPSIEDNHLTFQANGVQLRLSTGGEWYPYTVTAHGWAPARGHSLDPADAYQTAVAARRQRHG